MKIGNRKNVVSETINRRVEETLKYAITQVDNSPLPSYAERMILYGSCARGEHQYNSDVDLLLEIRKEGLEIWKKTATPRT